MPDETKARPVAPAGSPADPAPDHVSPKAQGQLTVSPQSPAPPAADPQPGKQPWWLWVGLGAVVVAAAALFYFQPWVTKGLPVTVETVSVAPLVRVLAVNGRVAALHPADVKSAVSGEVILVLAEEGASVKQGDVLARIDASGQQAMVRQAMAALDAGLVAQSQAMASLARAKALGDNISRTARDDARTAQQAAAQEVARLTALFDQAQIGLAKYTIVAPVAGTVLRRNAEVGQSVDTATGLFSVADLGQLVVETDVDERYATQITPGLTAVLQLKGETAMRDGRVSFVASQVDAATGGLAVKITFDDAVTAPVGLTVTANIVVDTQDAAIAVPRAAVVQDGVSAAVFVAVADHAVRRAVTVVDWPADRVQVTDGLSAGDRVITDATGVSDGLAITLAAEP